MKFSDFNQDKIKELIPHREPFLFLDNVMELSHDEDDNYIICDRYLDQEDAVFLGHFPGYPIMPGVLIVEALAQAAAVYAFYTIGKEAEGKKVFFTSIERAKFRRPVYPGKTLILRADLIRKSRILWKFTCIARIAEEICAEAEITATIG